MGDDGKKLFVMCRPVRQIAAEWGREDSTPASLSIADVFDVLLLELGFVLWFEQVARWS